MAAGTEPARPGRAAGGAGREPGPRARPDPLRPDAGLAVHVLPGRRADHGGRPGRHPAVRHHRAALRRRAPVELRRVRVARAPAAVRHQRLRRDASRPVGVGRQAAGGELRGRGPRARVLAPPIGARSSWRGVVEYRRAMRLAARDADARRLVRPHRRRPDPRAGCGSRSRRSGSASRSCGKRSSDVAKARTRDSSRVFAKRAGRGRRRAADRRRPAADRADRRPRAARASQQRRTSKPRCSALLRSYRRIARERPPSDRGVPLRPHGAQGRRRRQRRDARWILLLVGRDDDDPLFLQAKEAQASVLERFLGTEPRTTTTAAGRRRPAADAGRQRHLPRLAAGRWTSTA